MLALVIRNVSNVERIGRVEQCPDQTPCVQVLDPLEEPIAACVEFLRHAKANDMHDSSLVSYANDLLRWFRFLWEIKIEWNKASRDDVRDFVLWMKQAHKGGRKQPTRHIPGSVNVQTGKRYLADNYAASTINHNLSVVSVFYDFQLDRAEGLPLVNPVPKQRGADGGRAYGHQNPLDEFRRTRRAEFRQREPERLPRAMPDEEVSLVFDRLTSDRDRALLEFYLTSAARPAELLAVPNSWISPPDKTITVVRKGTRAVQALPASAAAFQWFRKYQEKLAPELTRPDQPAWWTLRSPVKPLNYDAMRAVFRRVNEALGTNWTLHDLRHTSALRMANDREMTLPEIRKILGQKHLSTTQKYLGVREDEVLASAHAHLVRREKERAEDAELSEPDRLARRGVSMRSLNYDPADLEILFGESS